MSDVSRRTVVRNGAWAVPAVAIATAVPAYATSGPKTSLTTAVAWKCPGEANGRPTNYPKTTIVTFTFGEVVTNFVAVKVLFRGEEVAVTDTVNDCDDPKVWHVIFATNGTSQHGSSEVTYMADGVVATTPVIEDNHPYPHRYPCYGNC